MYKASIIVSIDNSFPIINNFFNSLFSNISKKDFEILVVNDACSDLQTITYVQELNTEGKIDTFINLKSKNGFGKANNIGVTHSSTECLIFMNSDIIIVDDILYQLVNVYLHKKYAAIQPLLLYPQTERIQSAGHVFATYFNRHYLENNSIRIFTDNAPIIRQSLTLAFCVVDKKLFFEAGGFNEFYYNGYEGMELILKISQKNKCALLPNLKAYHVRSVAIKNATFSEEQKIPYFWCNCTDIINNDFIESIQKYFSSEIKESVYLSIQLTSLDLYSEVKQAGINISENVLLLQDGKIELFSLLPYSYLHTPTPLLFLCDNFMQLKNNSLWIKLRNSESDLIIDACGNVFHLKELQ